MSHKSADRLYNLMPAVYRLRDATQGHPLQAVLTIMEGLLQALETDVENLYENWFIETCDEWVIPYIGDLLGIRGVYSASSKTYSQRARIANTIRYRRRKGTAVVLEQVSRDATDWPTRVLEFFKLLVKMQHLNHLQLNTKTPDLRDVNQLELLGGPFESTAHTADVRGITFGGKYNIPNIGLFSWRLQSYPVDRAMARSVTNPADGRYTFSPLGLDAPLFNWPQTETDITHLAEEVNVPGILRRRALYDELNDRREALAMGKTPAAVYFGNQPVFQVFVDGNSLPPDEIVICNLSDPATPTPGGWRRPIPKYYQTKNPPQVRPSPPAPGTANVTVTTVPGAHTLKVDGKAVSDWQVLQLTLGPHQINADVATFQSWAASGNIMVDNATSPTATLTVNGDGALTLNLIQVAVDPELGRLDFSAGFIPAKIEVSYSYGFGGDIGGGPYDRGTSLSSRVTKQITWQARVSGLDADNDDKRHYTTLAKAVEKWNDQPPGTVGIIAISDSRTYEEDLKGADKIIIPNGSQLMIIASGWPETELPIDIKNAKRILESSATGLRPHLLGDLSVKGKAADNETPGELAVDGLLVEGAVTILTGNLGSLRLSNCTLLPAKGGLAVTSSVTSGQQNSQLSITIDRSICGPIDLPNTVQKLQISDSIIDQSGAESAISAPGAEAQMATSTILGKIVVPPARLGLRSLLAENSIFTDTVMVTRRQVGCVRFCYVPDGSGTPRRYHCQPDLAMKGVTDPGEKAKVLARLKPSFTSTHYGDAAYAQLGKSCATELLTGAEDGSEMGAFSYLKQPQREANLRGQLDEYLPFGLDADVIKVT